MPDLAGTGRVTTRLKVAAEGQTVDGRELSRLEILSMAHNYNPQHYAARINIEHISGWSPEPPFNAYGDVLSAEAVEENGKLYLYNTISALPNLQKINKAGQKIYPSIEFYRNFAGTGSAYQVALAFTDIPASLGTSPLKLNRQTFSVHSQPDKDIFMTNPTMTEQHTEAVEEKSLLQQLKAFVTPQAASSKENLSTETAKSLVVAFKQITQLGEQVIELKQQFSQLLQQQTQNAVPHQAPTETPKPDDVPVPLAANTEMSQLSQQVNELKAELARLSTTSANPPPAPVSGADSDVTPY